MSLILERRPRRRGRRIPIYIGDPQRIAEQAVARFIMWRRRGCGDQLAAELATRDAIRYAAVDRFRRDQ